MRRFLLALALLLPTAHAQSESARLLYDPRQDTPHHGADDELSSPARKALVAAPAVLTAYCKPGTLGKLEGDGLVYSTQPTGIEGQFTKKVRQRLTLIPVCEHKRAEVTVSWIYGVAVTDIPAAGREPAPPVLMFYIVGPGGAYGAVAGSDPVRLEDWTGDGLHELGLLKESGDGGTQGTSLQVYALGSAPQYLMTLNQSLYDGESRAWVYDATLYVTDLPTPTVVGVTYGAKPRVHVLGALREDLTIVRR